MLDLSNIQGNILRGYASFPEAHFHFLDIQSAGEARAFIQRLLNDDAVTRAQWPRKPDATLNVMSKAVRPTTGTTRGRRAASICW